METHTDLSAERKAYIEYLEQEIPPFLTEKHPMFEAWTGLTSREMAIYVSLAQGPDNVIGISGRYAYEKNALISWIMKNMDANFISKINKATGEPCANE